MLTVYYLAATWVQSWRLNGLAQKLRAVTDKHGSLAVHQELAAHLYAVGTTVKQKLEVNGFLSDHCINFRSGQIGDLFWQQGNKRAVSVFPKQILDVSGWIRVLPRKTHLPIQFNEFRTREPIAKDNVIYVLVDANYLTCSFDYGGRVIELDKFGTPLAWHASDRLSLLLETTERGLTQLLLVFMQNDVTLENGVQILRVLTVEPLGAPYKINNEQSVPETYARFSQQLSGPELKNSLLDRWRAHVSMLCSFCEAVAQVKEAQQDISVRHPGSGVGAVQLVPGVEAIGVGSDLVDMATRIIDLEPSTSAIKDSSKPHCSSSGQSSQTSSDVSTTTAHGGTSTRQVADSNTTSMSSIRSLPATPRRTVRLTPVLASTKPPNVIIFSDSSSALDSVKAALESTLTTDKYVLHKLTFAEMISSTWLDDAALVVIHGNVPPSFTPTVVDYLTRRGSASLLCLCSDFLGWILPTFRTAEVRPNELVRCSYKSWRHVPLVHNVFCYQPTPCDSDFTHDDQAGLKAIPDSVEISDSTGKSHPLKIDVLGVEETWHTPSMLLVTFKDVGSKIIFSQVHLEAAPDQFEEADALRTSDTARREILADVLANHLDMKCAPKSSSAVAYTVGYFLGNHEAKQAMLDKLRADDRLENDLLRGGAVTLKFCGKGISPPAPSESILPILNHSCPESFSTVEYYENLKTQHVGRLVVFSEVMTSCLSLLESVDLSHGLAAIPYYQTKGIGRSGNTWLSPKGCAMFAVQLHIPLDSYMGQHFSLVQILAALAVVTSICENPQLEELDVGIKWPNDIYVNKNVKLGGIAVKTVIRGSVAVVNIGCGLNLNNKAPTVCLNDVIDALAKEKNSPIPRLSFERYFSSVFNKIEWLLVGFDEGRVDEFYQLYYRYWLHSDAEVTIIGERGTAQLVKVKGIDDFGFLTVETSAGSTLTVHPDGNSFDMMSGLISPKLSD